MKASSRNSNNHLVITAKRTIASYDMLKKRDKVLVGVSGGADSIALLHFLLFISSEYELTIGVAHLNHLLRGEDAFKDEEFVKSRALFLDIPFFSDRKNVREYKREKKISLEEAARDLRYRFFQKTALENGYDKTALAHNLDDNAELLLMRIIRGCGMSGLSGIPPVRDDKYIRPFIKTEKAAIYDYIKSKNLRYIQDKSNYDTKFLRNKIRHRLIPLLKEEYNPNIIKTLDKLSSIAEKEDKWFVDTAGLIFEKAVFEKNKNRITFSADVLNKTVLAERRRVIREALRHIKKNLRNISFIHIDSIIRLAKSESDYASVDIAGELIVLKEKNLLIITKRSEAPKREVPPYEYILKKAGSILIQEAGLILKFEEIPIRESSDIFKKKRESSGSTGYFDADKIEFPLIIRNFKNGDIFIPLGMQGRQKLKKFFNRAKVSVQERKKCPIVISKKKIIWIAGYRTDDTSKVTESTQKIIKSEVFLA